MNYGIKNEPKTNPILSSRSLWRRRIKRKKQPGRFAKTGTVWLCHSPLALHRNRLSKIIDIAANLEEKMQAPPWDKLKKYWKKNRFYCTLPNNSPINKRKYNVDKIAYGRDNSFFYFLLTVLLMFLGAPIFGIKVPKWGL